MKKTIALMLGFATFAHALSANVSANTPSQKIDNQKSALKIFTKFSVPITATVVVAGIGAFSYYKYKNPIHVITGNVTKENAEEILKDIENFKNSSRHLTLIFENASIKREAFESKTFDCDVLFRGNCEIENEACKETHFNGKFEIAGSISETSSLSGAIFSGDLIINGKIPDNLFLRATATVGKKGTKYKLPNKPQIIYNKQNLNDVTEYLKTFIK